MVQISIDLSEEDRIDIKVRSAKRGMSMNMWIFRAIAKQIKEEDLYKKDDRK